LPFPEGEVADVPPGAAELLVTDGVASAVVAPDEPGPPASPQEENAATRVRLISPATDARQ